MAKTDELHQIIRPIMMFAMHVRLVAGMLIMIVVLLSSMSSCASAEATGTDYVYICTGPKAKVYHHDKKCKGLSKCSGTVKSIHINEASGTRRPCRMCAKMHI